MLTEWGNHEDKEPQNTMIDNITQKKLIYSKKQWKKCFFPQVNATRFHTFSF